MGSKTILARILLAFTCCYICGVRSLLADDVSVSTATDDFMITLKNADVDIGGLRNALYDAAKAKRHYPEILGLLKNPNTEIRHMAVSYIGDFGPEAASAVQELGELLSDKDSGCAAAYSLGKIGQAGLPELVKASAQPGLFARDCTISTLGEFGPQAAVAVPGLIKALSDSNISVRRETVRTLGKIGPKAGTAVPELEKLVRDRELGFYVFESLGKIGEAATPTLVKYLSDKDSGLRNNAAHGLGIGKLTPLEALPALANMFRRWDTRGYAEAALANYTGEASAIATELHTILIYNHDWNGWDDYPNAAAAVGNIYANNDPERLKLILKESDPIYRACAVYALQKHKINPEEYIQNIAPLINDSDPAVRKAVAYALRGFGKQLKSVVPVLLQALKDPSMNVRESAIESIKYAGGNEKEVAAAVADALFSPSDAVRQEAVGYLLRPEVQSGEIWPQLMRLAHEASKEDKRVAYELISKINFSTNAAAAFSELLNSCEGSDCKTAALYALGNIGPEAKVAEETIGRLISDQSPEIRLAALIALRTIGPKSPKPFLEALKTGDSNIRTSAAIVLGEGIFKDEEIVAALMEHVKDPDVNARVEAIVSLGNWGEKGALAVPALAEVLADDSEVGRGTDHFTSHVREYVMEALGNIGVKSAPATPAMIKTLNNYSDTMATNMINAIEKIGPAALPYLIEGLKSSNNHRGTIVVAIAYVGPEAAAALPEMEKVLSDPDEKVRNNTIQALGMMKAPAVPVLIKALNSKYIDVIEQAAEELGNIGPEAKDAVPELKKAMNSKYAFARAKAVVALGKIDK